MGYMVTAVDRPSINREAYVHTVDFDFKPSAPTRVYGWLSQAHIKDNQNDTVGTGARVVVTKGFSDQLFVLGAIIIWMKILILTTWDTLKNITKSQLVVSCNTSVQLKIKKSKSRTDNI